MIEIVPESERNILGMKVRHNLTGRDYTETLVPHLDWVVQQYGKARLLFSLEKGISEPDDESPWEPSRFGSRHRDQVERIAVIGEEQWTEWAQKVCERLSGCEVKIFTPGQWDRAWDWLTL